MNKTSQNPEKLTILIELDHRVSADANVRYETEIIDDFPHPHCILPDGFFEPSVFKSDARGAATPLLSINRLDGREILSVIKRQ